MTSQDRGLRVRRGCPAAALLAAAAGASAALGQVVGGPVPPRILESPVVIDQGAPMIACFQVGTDPRYVEAVRHFLELRNQAFYGQDYNLGTRWSGAQGSHRTLTWSFVPDGLTITTSPGEEPSAPSELFSQFDTAFASQGGRATWTLRFQQVFDRWAQLTGNTFTRVRFNNNDWDDGAAWGTAGAAGLRGDMRISMHFIDGPDNVLAYCFFPSSGDMVIDSADVNFFKITTNANRNLRNVAAHELGHGLGLDHTCSTSDILMAPLIDPSFDGPRQDDIRAIQRHYGDPFEANDTFATAYSLGTLIGGSPLSVGALPAPVAGTNDANAALCSIDGDGEQDWYSFTVGSAMPITAVVTPIGSTYQDNPENVCSSGTNFTNAKNIADLAIQVYSTNGTTVLATAASAGVGLAETVSNLALPAAGTYFIKIYATNHPTQTQLYTLSLTSSCASMPAFTLQPLPRTVESGATVMFTAAASNTTGYQWRKDGVDLLNGGRVSGATSTTLTITGVMSTDQGVYTLRATGGCGAATSNGAALTVSCYANCDGSTAVPILNVSDFVCFYNKYLASDTYANCDGSTTVPTLNIYDFICFQQKYTHGCP